MFSFDSQFLRVDVTAAKIYSNFFLIGVGGFLNIFDKKTGKAVTKVRVFEDQKIYGIVLNNINAKILLYGGRYLKCFAVNITLTYFNELSFTVASDWILAAKWIDNDKEIATVSMHNKLHVWNESLDLMTEIECDEKCILYSAHICYEEFNKLVVLSGTVFSEILIWQPSKSKDGACVVLKRLQRHNGVIFSVHYAEESGYICSSSDDRSSILWKINTKSLYSELQQSTIDIKPACQVFGHLSRVFRCQVLNKCFITGGEDSFLCVWSFNGQLLRKIETHQGGPIWALDCDEANNLILTGGGDCGATTFLINSTFVEQPWPLPKNEAPRAVGVLASHSLVAISENGILYYLTGNQIGWKIAVHEDLKSYALLVLASCKKCFALAGFYGQIYLYKEQCETIKQISSFQTKDKSRIFSLHWLTCHTFLICQDEGKISMFYLKDNNILPVTSFVLPPSKERWSTCAVFVRNDKLVIGDRKGNIHLFQIGKTNAIQSIKRCHSHLGVTNVVTESNSHIVKSLGRNGVVKTFCIKKGVLNLLSTEKLPFTWLVNIVDTLLLAFSGDSFIIWSYTTKRTLFEKSCGGGHRSWDFFKSDTATFCYIKDKTINAVEFQLNNFIPNDVIEGYHVKEINTVEFIKVANKFLLISGSEDTTLRISVAHDDNISNIMALKSHLSSIRAITKFLIKDKPEQNKQTYLIFSAGGRAQIVCWKLSVFGLFKNISCSEEHSYYKPIQCEESEMRIMDLCVTEIGNNLALFCACSDGNIKVFFVKKNDEKRYHLTFCRDIFYKLKCIIKLQMISLSVYRIMVTMATDGRLVFWDVKDIFKDDVVKPLYKLQVHQSGINSSAIKTLNSDSHVILTGGDDNAIVLVLIKISTLNGVTEIKKEHSVKDTSTHCAQITGVYLGEKHFITASIDQRVAIFAWEVQNAQIVCKFITKYNTTVADVQGLGCFEHYAIDAFVYGKGIEYVKIKKKPEARFH